jgi:hypothetical protein
LTSIKKIDQIDEERIPTRNQILGIRIPQHRPLDLSVSEEERELRIVSREIPFAGEMAGETCVGCVFRRSSNHDVCRARFAARRTTLDGVIRALEFACSARGVRGGAFAAIAR